jgi:hypothetical protein
VSLCGLRFVQGLKAAEKSKFFGRERAIGYVTKYLILVQEISDFCREHAVEFGEPRRPLPQRCRSTSCARGNGPAHEARQLLARRRYAGSSKSGTSSTIRGWLG